MLQQHGAARYRTSSAFSRAGLTESTSLGFCASFLGALLAGVTGATGATNSTSRSARSTSSSPASSAAPSA